MKNLQYIRQAQYKKGFAPVALIVILVILAGGGYILVKKSKVQSPKQEAKGEQNVVSGTENQTITDETTDWKTYRNDKYGFEFKYPPDWKETAVEPKTVYGYIVFVKSSDEKNYAEDIKSARSKESDIVALIDQGRTFDIRPYDKKELDALFADRKEFKSIFSQMKFSGNTVTKIFSDGWFGGGSLEEYVFINKEGGATVISARYSDTISSASGELKIILDKVIPTFKFTK